MVGQGRKRSWTGPAGSFSRRCHKGCEGLIESVEDAYEALADDGKETCPSDIPVWIEANLTL